MTFKKHNTANIFSPALLLKVGMLLLCLFVFAPAFSQNTKGDKPARESRFRPFKGGGQKQKSRSGKRVKTKTKSSSNRAGAGVFSRSRQSSSQISNKPIRPIVRSTPSSRQRAWKGDITGRRIRAKSEPARVNRNVYSQNASFVHNNSRRPSERGRPVSNRRALSNLKRLQGPEPSKPGRKQVVSPRSASGSFMARNTRRNWTKFPNPRKKSGDVAFTRDISGRRLRSKNFHSPSPGLLSSSPRSSRSGSDRSFRGRASGGYVSRTRTGRAWRGDITGGAIRGRNYSSKGNRTENAGSPVSRLFNKNPRRGDRIRNGRSNGGYRSASQPGEKRTGKSPLPARVPGIGANGIGGFSGRIKGRRPLKGGGSVSGRVWNNGQSPLNPRVPGIGSSGVGFGGRIKGRRPLKGGGSVSGRVWNNGQSPLNPRIPKGLGGIGYSGRIKGQRPLKGGGSVSGRVWNNGQSPLNPRIPKSLGGIGYSGRIKGGRPMKGGGSVSGKLWNNKRSPIGVRPPSQNAQRAGGFPGHIKRFSLQPGFADQGEEFTGYIRARKPLKGGGSVSGRLWNNKQSAIPVKTPPPSAQKAGGFPGNIKRYSVQPGFSDQGEEFTGYIKKPWYRRAYSRNPNAHEKATRQRSPDQTTYMVGNLYNGVKRRKYVKNKSAAELALMKLEPTKATKESGELQIKVKRPKYVKNPNASELALKKVEPSTNTYQVGELQIKVKRPAIGKKLHGAEGSLPGIKPSSETVKASQYARSVKRNWNYIRNPSSSKDALHVREPGRAFAKATDYQGNIKMNKFNLFKKSNLHPDAQFVKTNKNNVAEERGLFTNIKLWWAKTFKKNETQPDHLKEKGRKPRYDKGEQGLWYE